MKVAVGLRRVAAGKRTSGRRAAQIAYREPHYRYEVNWLLMRELNDDELEEAIQKYGSPDAYYDSQH